MHRRIIQQLVNSLFNLIGQHESQNLQVKRFFEILRIKGLYLNIAMEGKSCE